MAKTLKDAGQGLGFTQDFDASSTDALSTRLQLMMTIGADGGINQPSDFYIMDASGSLDFSLQSTVDARAEIVTLPLDLGDLDFLIGQRQATFNAPIDLMPTGPAGQKVRLAQFSFDPQLQTTTIATLNAPMSLALDTTPSDDSDDLDGNDAEYAKIITATFSAQWGPNSIAPTTSDFQSEGISAQGVLDGILKPVRDFVAAHNPIPEGVRDFLNKPIPFLNNDFGRAVLTNLPLPADGQPLVKPAFRDTAATPGTLIRFPDTNDYNESVRGKNLREILGIFLATPSDSQIPNDPNQAINTFKSQYGFSFPVIDAVAGNPALIADILKGTANPTLVQFDVSAGGDIKLFEEVFPVPGLGIAFDSIRAGATVDVSMSAMPQLNVSLGFDTKGLFVTDTEQPEPLVRTRC